MARVAFEWAGQLSDLPRWLAGQRASGGSQGSVPPVMAFHLGSLGFLTPFNFENFQSQVTQVIQGESECSRTHKQFCTWDRLM